jgi:branched-chain amino acid transport system substrate-binding protein
VQIIVDSVDRIGSSTDHNALRATFETVRTDGLTGPIRLTPSDHSGLMPQALTLLTARNGRWRLS